MGVRRKLVLVEPRSLAVLGEQPSEGKASSGDLARVDQRPASFRPPLSAHCHSWPSGLFDMVGDRFGYMP